MFLSYIYHWKSYAKQISKSQIKFDPPHLPAPLKNWSQILKWPKMGVKYRCVICCWKDHLKEILKSPNKKLIGPLTSCLTQKLVHDPKSSKNDCSWSCISNMEDFWAHCDEHVTKHIIKSVYTSMSWIILDLFIFLWKYNAIKNQAMLYTNWLKTICF